MVLPRDVRLLKLKSLMQQTDKAIGHQKLYYKAESRSYPVFQIDLDCLVYNRHNGRLETEMQTWQSEHAASADVYDDELHSLIENFLWQTNASRNKYTLDDLGRKGQQRPGIVTLDGVIIDGNRRAMLLRRLEPLKREKQYLEAVILPDAYDENEKEIVRLETQYQIGEDAKLEYGPLEKYLHVKRLRHHLEVPADEIGQLMGESESEIRRLLAIMDLMDDYLAHIGCDGLYKMLKEDDGSTKEGMFVDLYSDLKRLGNGGSAQVQWPYDPEVDLLDLKTIQFDHVRYGADFSGTNKNYRAISHGSGKKSFFAHEEIWSDFTTKHRTEIDSVTSDMGDLDTYCVQHPEFQSRNEAARARDAEWRAKVTPSIKRNFGIAEERLEGKVEEIEPRRLLERAFNALSRIDIDHPGFLVDPSNFDLIKQINQLTYEMKRRFEKANRDGRPFQ